MKVVILAPAFNCVGPIPLSRFTNFRCFSQTCHMVSLWPEESMWFGSKLEESFFWRLLKLDNDLEANWVGFTCWWAWGTLDWSHVTRRWAVVELLWGGAAGDPLTLLQHHPTDSECTNFTFNCCWCYHRAGLVLTKEPFQRGGESRRSVNCGREQHKCPLSQHPPRCLTLPHICASEVAFHHNPSLYSEARQI